ncbi:zinc-dependent alcohol dehydrogenase family protein [Henriciella aquimarina]|uniref:zinc-dependent alcohol dehydrogenase family protein n=1 Tax=Henriciella aquimarina TaxID=545261 RepID=UPI000A05EAD9|nr:NAD(P)-dependent alcohol dehydrogenase [Henriciella aquimarina]
MKAVKIAAPGGFDKLNLVDVEDPGQPGKGEIRVKLHATSLNFHDLLVTSGQSKPEDGRIPMSDGAGIVEAVGEGVSDFAEGDHVVSTFFPQWLAGPPRVSDFSGTPGDGIDGYAREAVVASQTSFTKSPKGWSHAEAATITTAGLTAWRALVVDGGLKAGDTVLALGTGGVSVYAVQIAKMMGAEVIVTSSSDEKLAQMKALGADHLINYKADENWGRTVTKLTGGRGADHVIEVGGAGTLAQSIRAVRTGGHIALIGVLTGVSGDVPTALLMQKQARVEGLIVGSRANQEDFVRALGKGGLSPVIDERRFRLDSLGDAFAYQQSGGHVGKIVATW